MKKIKWISMLLFIALILGGCKREEPMTDETVMVSDMDEAVEEVVLEEEVQIEEVEEDVLIPAQEVPAGMGISYLTGEYIPEELVNKRPVAVMINNVKAAIPSSSTSKASIYYEAPVEGAVTRIMAVFEDYSGLEKIGSVRSCRDYFLDYAMNFDCIYVHYGQAVYALQYLDSDAIDNINGMDGYTDPNVFYRSTDRKSPHNAYTSTDGINYGIEYKNYRTDLKEDYKPQFTFANVGDVVNLENGQDVSVIKTGSTYNQAWFEYNPDDGLYYRYEYESAQMDEFFNTQLAVKNVIIQVSDWENYDENGYLNMYTQNGGAFMYFTNGKMIEGTWSREGKWQPEKYVDSEGNELVLNPGKTWVFVVQNTYADRIELS